MAVCSIEIFIGHCQQKHLIVYTRFRRLLCRLLGGLLLCLLFGRRTLNLLLHFRRRSWYQDLNWFRRWRWRSSSNRRRVYCNGFGLYRRFWSGGGLRRFIGVLIIYLVRDRYGAVCRGRRWYGCWYRCRRNWSGCGEGRGAVVASNRYRRLCAILRWAMIAK